MPDFKLKGCLFVLKNDDDIPGHTTPKLGLLIAALGQTSNSVPRRYVPYPLPGK